MNKNIEHIVELVIKEIKETAMINNSESPVLYVSMYENGIYVNGDGSEWNYKFSQDEMDAVMQELMKLGAVPNKNNRNMVIFNEPSLLLSQTHRR